MAIEDIRLREQKIYKENTDYESIMSVDGVSVDQTSVLQNNISAKGIVLVVTLANEADVAGFTPTLQIFDAAGTAVNYWVAAAELTANGTYVYVLHPSAPASPPATIKEAKAMCLPRKWRLLMDYTTGTPGVSKFDIDVSFAYII